MKQSRNFIITKTRLSQSVHKLAKVVMSLTIGIFQNSNFFRVLCPAHVVVVYQCNGLLMLQNGAISRKSRIHHTPPITKTTNLKYVAILTITINASDLILLPRFAKCNSTSIFRAMAILVSMAPIVVVMGCLKMGCLKMRKASYQKLRPQQIFLHAYN